MKNYLRVILVIALMLGIFALASGEVAWAGPSPAVESSILAQDGLSAPLSKSEPGTVKPPPPDVTVCEKGTHSIGGIAILEVTELAPGYCLGAILHNKAFAIGRIPDGAGTVLADATFLRVYYRGRFVYDVPQADGNIEICYAVPPGMTGQIYFFDFFGPRFGERTGQPAWEPLQTTVENGIACAPAQTSGAYALIGK